MGGTDESITTLVDKAVKMLTEPDDGAASGQVSEEELGRSDSRQKRKYNLVDMFPSSGKLPNFKKKADQLKKKKTECAGPSKKTSAEEKKKKKRTKSFLVIKTNYA